MVNINLGTLPISACYQGDFSGDGTITVDELVRAVNMNQSGDAHDQTVGDAPNFGTDSRHLVAASPGSDEAKDPSSIAGVPICRVASCDADSHGRPSGTAYDMGAYEGTGQQGASSTCVNVAAGQCIGSALPASLAPSSAQLRLGSVTACPQQVVSVPVVVSGTGRALGGIEVDIIYDAELLEVQKPGCMVTVPGYPGKIYTAAVPGSGGLPEAGRLRVLLVDLGGGRFGDGEVMRCKFKVREGASGRAGLAVAHAVVADAGGESLGVDVQVAEVEVSESCKGKARRR